MSHIKKPWIKIIATFALGVALGVGQFLSGSQISVFNNEIDPLVYRSTAEIEPLLSLTSPDKQASLDEWYRFALSLDDLDLGERYNNDADATPLLSWYAYIAKHKPQALYKLYNQGKLNEFKFQHLLRYGYLKYWDEYIHNVDEVLLKNNQAVLTMAYNEGVDNARQRVKQAFFKLGNQQLAVPEKNILDIDLLLFAMKSMTVGEKSRVLPILETAAFDIDPRFFYSLRLTETFKDRDILVSLIERYSKTDNITNRENTYSDNKVLSGYMSDITLLGSQKYIQTMIENLELNSGQPVDYFCAACGLALATDGLIAYPLINAAKRSKISINKTIKNDAFILSRSSKKE